MYFHLQNSNLSPELGPSKLDYLLGSIKINGKMYYYLPLILAFSNTPSKTFVMMPMPRRIPRNMVYLIAPRTICNNNNLYLLNVTKHYFIFLYLRIALSFKIEMKMAVLFKGLVSTSEVMILVVIMSYVICFL